MAVTRKTRSLRQRRGFTLVELLIAAAIIVTLAGMAIPSLARAREFARVGKAISEIQTLDLAIARYQLDQGQLPTTLGQLGPDVPTVDPWGSPYQFLNFTGINGNGQMRKDRFLVPINSTYDLYSMGPDGRSRPPLTARDSRDDIIRANDGAYVGPAVGY